jgi:hypothetical protein
MVAFTCLISSVGLLAPVVSGQLMSSDLTKRSVEVIRVGHIPGRERRDLEQKPGVLGFKTTVFKLKESSGRVEDIEPAQV